MHTVKTVSAGILWANLHLLSWLSLIPFTTGWMGDTEFGQWPVFLYAFNLLAATIAYTILMLCIKAIHGKGSDIDRAIGSDTKGKIWLTFYFAAMAASFFVPLLGMAFTVAVALIWFIPDTRIEKVLASKT